MAPSRGTIHLNHAPPAASLSSAHSSLHAAFHDSGTADPARAKRVVSQMLTAVIEAAGARSLRSIRPDGTLPSNADVIAAGAVSR